MSDISKIDFEQERTRAEKNICDNLNILKNIGDKRELSIYGSSNKSGSTHISITLTSSLINSLYPEKKKLLREYLKEKKTLFAIKLNGAVVLIPGENL